MSKRILHLIASNFVGGPEKQILHHAADVNSMSCGYEIHIGSFQDAETVPEIVSFARNQKLPNHLLSGGVRWKPVTELMRLLRREKISILCTHGYKANTLGRIASARTHTPHVAFVRGWTAETPRVRLYERIERIALRYAPWVVCVSARQATQIAPTRSHDAAPVVIPNSILPEPGQSHSKTLTREEVGLPEDAFLFGSLGRLSVEKGHRYLLEAFAILRAKLPTAKIFLVLLGEGRELPSLEQLASVLGIGSHVMFAGFQRQSGQWMKLLDCMVQPSLTEGTPNSVLEALLAEVPVVATAVGGVPDLLTDKVSGLLVRPGDPQALAAAMQSVFESAELRQKLSQARTAVNPAYLPENQRRSLLRIYEQVLQSHG